MISLPDGNLQPAICNLAANKYSFITMTCAQIQIAEVQIAERVCNLKNTIKNQLLTVNSRLRLLSLLLT